MIQINNPSEQKNEEGACYCGYLDEAKWDELDIDWRGKQFFKVPIRCWLYVPKDNIGTKILDAYKEIAKKGYGVIPFGLMLYNTGFLRGNIYIEIKKGALDDPSVKTFRGYIHSKIYIGPYKNLPLVAKTFSFVPLKVYYAYFSCPACTWNPNEHKTVVIAEKNYS